jgi:ribosomal protein S11
MLRNRSVERSKGLGKDMCFIVHPDGFIYVYLYLTQTYNNFFLTLTDDKGSVIKSASGGFSHLRGTKRRTYTSAEIVATKFLEEFQTDFSTIISETRVVFIFQMKPNIILNTILNVLIGSMAFSMFIEVLKIPHNRMRGRKVRRIL